MDQAYKAWRLFVAFSFLILELTLVVNAGAREQRLVRVQTGQNMDWSQSCSDPDLSTTSAGRIIDEAMLVAKKGDIEQSREGLSRAVSAALEEFFAVKRLGIVICVAALQDEIGFPADAEASLKRAISDARVYFDESEPSDLLMPTMRLLAVADLQRLLLAHEDAAQTLAYAEGLSKSAPASLTTFFIAIKFGQFHQLWGETDLADESFSKARDMIPRISTIPDSPEDQALLSSGEVPHPAYLFAGLAQDEAAVGRSDLANMDVSRANEIGRPHSAEVQERLVSMLAAVDRIISAVEAQ